MPRGKDLLSPETMADIQKQAERERAAGTGSQVAPFNPEKGNIQNGTGSPDSFLKSINFTPEPNVMGDLYQPTYHFSFYLDTDVETDQGKGNHFVIAETGLTGMNIQDVDIDSFVGPNVRTRNATATSITIKIYEPYGAQLPDLLYQAATKMSIRNYLKAPWFLRLKLWGYDDEGKVVTVGKDWLWKLVLIDIKSQVSETGALHTVECMPIAEVALNNQFCMLPMFVNSSGVTVGEALKNIVDSMNKNIVGTYGDTNPPVVEFAVEQEPYPYDTKVGISNPFDHKLVADAPQLSNQRAVKDFGTQITQFGAGTDIPAVVDILMSRTDTAIQAARISREKPPVGSPDIEQTVRDAASLMHRIDTKVEYLDYNSVVGDYCKKITYIVKPFQSLRLLTSMGRAMSFDKEKDLNIKKAQHAVDKVLMRKQYDYLFTGMNTEVEKFDINLNFRWAVQVPVIGGWNTYTGTTASVDNAANAQNHSMQLQQNRQQLDNATKELVDFDEEAAANQLDPNSEAGQARAARRAELQATVTRLQAENSQRAATVGAEQNSINYRANQEANRERRENPISGPIIDGEDYIYGNTIYDPKDKNKTRMSGAGTGGKSFLPISVVQDADTGGSMANNSSSDNNPNKSIYGALLNQLYGSFDGNLQAIELDVRGDPYWLGPGSNGQPYNEPSTATTPNFMNGEHIFVFRFKLPRGYNSISGSVNAREDGQLGKDGSSNPSGETASKVTPGGNSNIITGFYAATQVVHHFRGGYFSQTLHGVRIQGWSYENIIEGRENTVDDITIYSDSQAPVQPYTPPGGSGNGTGATTGNRGSGARTGNAPRGTRNNNPANMEDGRFTRRQPGYVGSDGRFAQFDTVENGIRAHETLLRHNYLQRPTTVRAVITRYAPPTNRGGDNSAASFENYIRSVERRLGKSNVTAADTSQLAYAMRQFESPGSP